MEKRKVEEGRGEQCRGGVGEQLCAGPSSGNRTVHHSSLFSLNSSQPHKPSMGLTRLRPLGRTVKCSLLVGVLRQSSTDMRPVVGGGGVAWSRSPIPQRSLQ